MFGKFAVFETNDVRNDPRSREPVSRKSSVRDNVVAFGKDDLIFVVQTIGKGAN